MVWFGFYGISTIEGYLMPDPVCVFVCVYIYIYIYMIHKHILEITLKNDPEFFFAQT